ncbi:MULTISPECIES: rubrerythrin family protein [Clostridium]|uniref:Predicted rubrerythrin n=2 Tax=Clostridium TaxID=1485 RepID=D8GM79_CLOLD|nr:MULTISPECIES: rubrerythrin family protein [Clostridium]ADK15653.1 predicted rubrerythrin [Clostridium ljungdahlii DSM 13528]AGY74893.1 rubrerythrin family protein [Clostridium autoethanogenum DSM 10061]ALU35070.1 Rubrerythrin [Clostridium autoethanogenum DSM 10061]OAA86536.1 Rubrerythrin-2 [Clostridium ljungdahlii DSM 13528]OVY49431.1 Rubrerythrin-2 [Clostridium autoethanogenum]
MALNNAMTADFLRSAYGGESMAHMRYLIWGDHAEKAGYPNIARLFRGIAYAEWAHAKNHFNVLKNQVGDNTVAAGAVFGNTDIIENLQGAINGELHEVDQMYPVYLETARFQNEKDAERSFHFALEAEKIHANMFKGAQEAAKSGKDIPNQKIYVCPICGYTYMGDNVSDCPVCGAKKEIFKEF